MAFVLISFNLIILLCLNPAIYFTLDVHECWQIDSFTKGLVFNRDVLQLMLLYELSQLTLEIFVVVSASALG